MGCSRLQVVGALRSRSPCRRVAVCSASSSSAFLLRSWSFSASSSESVAWSAVRLEKMFPSPWNGMEMAEPTRRTGVVMVWKPPRTAASGPSSPVRTPTVISTTEIIRHTTSSRPPVPWLLFPSPEDGARFPPSGTPTGPYSGQSHRRARWPRGPWRSR